MAHDIHHLHLVKELAEQLEPVFSHSPQGVYLYLDDEHKTCNKKFADMIGYSTPAEWVANQYPISDVVEEDQEKGIKAYMDASRNFKASSLPLTYTRKGGKKIHVQITLVPISYKGEVFVLHFISPKDK